MSKAIETGAADRELLVLAARATGRPISWSGNVCVLLAPAPYECSAWNPLIDDGDALRLAVKLGIEFYEGEDDGPAAYAGYRCRGDVKLRFVTQPHIDDAFAATRRAIVRAAAAIGEAM